jgi:hypothetical protein
MQGSAPVLDCWSATPSQASPPRYIRAVVYDYRFTDFAERRRSGAWWRREEKAISLRDWRAGYAARGRSATAAFYKPAELRAELPALRPIGGRKLHFPAQSLISVLHALFELGPYRGIAALPFLTAVLPRYGRSAMPTLLE